MKTSMTKNESVQQEIQKQIVPAVNDPVIDVLLTGRFRTWGGLKRSKDFPRERDDHSGLAR
jgi:hypothetical protein